MYKLVLFVVPVALFAASDSAKKTAKDTKSTQSASQPAAERGSITIPPDAEQIGPQVYRYKDSAGKSWIYRRTPFGISKMEELNVPATGTEAAAVPEKSKIKVQAFDKGDSVRFEQQTPMGPRVWERKKSELTSAEKAWLAETGKGSTTDSPKPEK